MFGRLFKKKEKQEKDTFALRGKEKEEKPGYRFSDRKKKIKERKGLFGWLFKKKEKEKKPKKKPKLDLFDKPMF